MAKDKTPKTRSDKLAKLFEQRDAAEAAYRTYVDDTKVVMRADSRTELNEVEVARRSELKDELDTYEVRILEVNAAVVREREIAEARANIGLDFTTLTVGEEVRTYGEDSPNSYFADLVRVSPLMACNDKEGAAIRLAQHATEVSAEINAHPTGELAKRARHTVKEHLRGASGATVESALKVLRVRADRVTSEVRTGMDTGSTSGGSFVTPQYFVSDYAAFRQFDARAFIDQSNKQPLPDYGMTVYIPSLSGPAGVSAQSNQNSGIQEEDPTAGYLSNDLTTNAGQVTVSQQLLDRAGPNFAFDKMVFDQLNRAYNVTADSYVLVQALANAGAITATTAGAAGAPAPATSTLTGIGYVQNKVAQAKAATVDASGTHLPATHVYFIPERWENLSSSTDVNGRNLVTPDYLGIFASVAAGGTGMPVVEGASGHRLQGLPVFEDGNIPFGNAPTNTQDQAIVAHMPEVWTFEGALTPRVVPQTFAQNLSVLLQLFAYITVIVRYPLAVQSITGAAFAIGTSSDQWLA